MMKNLLSFLAKLAAVVTVSSFFVVLPATAHADEDTQKVEEILTQDQVKRFEKMSDEDKNKMLDEVLGAIAKEKCADFNYYMKMESIFAFQKRDCEEQTRDALKIMYPSAETLVLGEGEKMDFCDALKETKASGEGISYCIDQRLSAQFWGWTGQKIRGFLEQSELGRGLLRVTDAIDNGIKFIADPKSSLEEVANSSKSESIALTTKVLEEITSATEFDASSQEFKDRWALYAGIGVIVLGLMMMFLFKQHSNGEMSDDDFSNSLLYYLPTSLFLVIYGPWVMSELQQHIAPLAAGTSDWSAEAISNFITVVSRFGSLEASSWFGPLAALIFFGLLFIGSISLLIYFLLVPIFQQLMGLAIAVLIGMLLSPKTRRYVLKIASVLGTMMFLKTAAFLVLGAVFSVLASQPAFESGTDDVLVNVGTLGATAAIMLLIVFSPAALFKWMPVLESREAKFGGLSPEISAGAGLAAGVAMGSTAGSVRRAISNRRNNSSGSNTSGSPTSGGPSSSAGSSQPNSGGSSAGRSTLGRAASVAAKHSNPTSGQPAKRQSAGSSPTGSAPAGGSDATPGSANAAGPGGSAQRAGQPQAGNSSGKASGATAQMPRPSSAPAPTGASGRGTQSSHAAPSTPAPASSSRPTDTTTGGGSGPAASSERGKSLAAAVAMAPLTGGAVGLLAGARMMAQQAAMQARIAANEADPDSWDSFKDR